MKSLLHRLLRSDTGQDVIEYALLTAAIGLAGVATWPAIATAVGVNYGRLDSRTQNLWRVPDPQ